MGKWPARQAPSCCDFGLQLVRLFFFVSDLTDRARRPARWPGVVSSKSSRPLMLRVMDRELELGRVFLVACLPRFFVVFSILFLISGAHSAAVLPVEPRDGGAGQCCGRVGYLFRAISPGGSR